MWIGINTILYAQFDLYSTERQERGACVCVCVKRERERGGGERYLQAFGRSGGVAYFLAFGNFFYFLHGHGV